MGVADRAIASWVDENAHLAEHQREGCVREMRERGRQRESAAEVLAADVPHLHTAGRLRIVAVAGLVTLAELEPMLQTLARTHHELAPRRNVWLAPVRRFPDPARPRVGFAEAATHVVHLDRVDALLALAGTVHAPQAQTLLRLGHAVLGHVLRDANAFDAWLEVLVDEDDQARRACVVAAGLIGYAVLWSLACPKPDGAADAAAWVLGLVAADHSRDAEVLDGAHCHATGDAARTITLTLRRITLGYPWSAVG